MDYKSVAIVVLLCGIVFSSQDVFAKTYRYKVLKRSMVQLKCQNEGKTELSRVKLMTDTASTSRTVSSIRLRIRVCTSFGFLAFSPRLAVPYRFLSNMDFGREFNDFEESFNSSIMTAIDGKAANKVAVSDLGVKPGRVDGINLNEKDIHWVHLEWKKNRRVVFGPVLLGYKLPNKVSAKGFNRSRDLPIQKVHINKDGRWVSGLLNRVD